MTAEMPHLRSLGHDLHAGVRVRCGSEPWDPSHEAPRASPPAGCGTQRPGMPPEQHACASFHAHVCVFGCGARAHSNERCPQTLLAYGSSGSHLVVRAVIARPQPSFASARVRAPILGSDPLLARQRSGQPLGRGRESPFQILLALGTTLRRLHRLSAVLTRRVGDQVFVRRLGRGAHVSHLLRPGSPVSHRPLSTSVELSLLLTVWPPRRRSEPAEGARGGGSCGS